MSSETPCPLCSSKASFFHSFETKTYWQCPTCKAVFLHPDFYLNKTEERERYSLHENDVHDKAYQNFVKPLTDAVQEDFPKPSTGLDYGCGTGPVVAKILSDAGYPIKLYDPFFHDSDENLNQKYNFIICCEVMEHFHLPRKEFERLHGLLVPKGKLYCKTTLLDDNAKSDFKNWWYKNDPSHVFFYSEDTLNWIQENLGFSKVDVFHKHIEFTA